ncbi:hypothetical protein SAMN02745121_03149 [Nannocystis exedens]|uniref:Sporulation related domain-containing protein n=1 Tax=Nannocystis exedens TaxID=54 RepID=A0A1I1Y8U4_9BACT|nr:hypothetical protein [Nannocystis exedens]PCC71797.1 hypothetical protein NAEX_04876 [Nannocystis exedens]SFE14290.1 hypothetical protein SAMN02745121_03149 [Nannocystis exedens]
MPSQPLPRLARPTLLAAVALCACDGHAPTPAKAAAPTASPAAAAGKPAEPDDDGATAPRTVKLDLQPVATRRGPISLHRLGDGEVVLAGGVLLTRVDADGNLAQEAGLLSGLHPAEPGAGWQVHALGGRDDDLWLTVARGGDDPAHRVYRRRENTWTAHEPDPDAPGAYYLDYATWPEGHAIALRMGGDGQAALVVLDDDGARPARPRLEVAGLSEAPRPTRLAGLASGELFASVAAGPAGAEGQPGLQSGMLRWGPTDATGIFAPLPGLESRAPKQVSALVESGGQVLIGDGVEIDDEVVPYVAGFDGTSWRLLDPPPARGAVVSLVETPEPALFAVVDEEGPADSLWRIHAGGDWDVWERVELPPVQLAAGWFWDQEAGAWASEPAPAAGLVPSPRAIGRDAAGSLWVSAGLLLPDGTASPHHAVLRSGPAAAPLALYDDGQIHAAQQDLLPRKAPRAGDPTCPQVYVHLYTVSEDSPEVGTPELRAALAGPLGSLLLGEVRSQGERQVGLLLAAGDYETHKAAIAGVAAKLRYRSRASCGHPPLLRGWRAGG